MSQLMPNSGNSAYDKVPPSTSVATEVLEAGATVDLTEPLVFHSTGDPSAPYAIGLEPEKGKTEFHTDVVSIARDRQRRAFQNYAHSQPPPRQR